jgi:hypothetical protein
MTRTTAKALRNWAIINMLIWFLLGMTSKESVFELPSTLPQEDANIIAYTIGKADQFKYLDSLVSRRNAWAGKSCAGGCEDDVSALKYNRCSDRNDYLSKEIDLLAGKSGLVSEMLRQNVNTNAIIKPICTMMGMEAKFNSSSNSFRQCSSGNDIKRVVRPCIDEDYFKLAHNSFNLVSSCMQGFVSPDATDADQKEDIRMTYAMINKESGFHINAASSTNSKKIGAGGIGQLTDVAITDVNNKQLGNIRKMLDSSGDGQCRELSRLYLKGAPPMKPSAGEACGRVSLKDGNPFKNIIYTYAYLKVNKDYLNSLVFKKYSAKFKGLPASELNEIKRAMMIWTHNTGIGGATTPMTALLNGPYRGKTVKDSKTFIKQMEQFLKLSPNRANRSAGRIKETTNYFPGIQKILNNIENNAGGGSCLN